MTDTQIEKLYAILAKESRKLEEIDEKYDKKKADIKNKYLLQWENGKEENKDDYISRKLVECQWIAATEPDNKNVDATAIEKYLINMSVLELINILKTKKHHTVHWISS